LATVKLHFDKSLRWSLQISKLIDMQFIKPTRRRRPSPSRSYWRLFCFACSDVPMSNWTIECSSPSSNNIHPLSYLPNNVPQGHPTKENSSNLKPETEEVIFSGPYGIKTTPQNAISIGSDQINIQVKDNILNP